MSLTTGKFPVSGELSRVRQHKPALQVRSGHHLGSGQNCTMSHTVMRFVAG